MDPIKLRVLIGAAGGALMGAGVTYILTKRKYEVILANEINSVKEAFSIRLEAAEDRIAQHEPERIVVPDAEEIVEYEKHATNYGAVQVTEEQLQIVTPHVSYDEHIEELVEAALEEDENDALMVEGKVFNDDEYAQRSGIEVISDKQYAEEYQHFEKLTFRWFAGDKSLADEQDNIVPNPVDVIGMSAFQYLDARGVEAEATHVRNYSNSFDIEILIESAGFEEVVLGIESSQEPG